MLVSYGGGRATLEQPWSLWKHTVRRPRVRRARPEGELHVVRSMLVNNRGAKVQGRTPANECRSAGCPIQHGDRQMAPDTQRVALLYYVFTDMVLDISHAHRHWSPFSIPLSVLRRLHPQSCNLPHTLHCLILTVAWQCYNNAHVLLCFTDQSFAKRLIWIHPRGT